MESKTNEWCWLNGQVMPLAEARISVEDRGFQFADGVYEVVRLYEGKPFALDAHMNRLASSCGGIKLTLPMSKESLVSEIMKLAEKSGLRDGMIYLQVTRGSYVRNHVFPAQVKPTILFYTRELPPLPEIGQYKPYTLLSVPDERWNRCWIKSISLLEHVLARNVASAKGADEAILIYEGNVTEGSASNLFLVMDGKVITHPLGPRILPGITREVLLEFAPKVGVVIEERAVKLEDAKQADEVFITSSTRELVWVSKWDETTIADSCGPITRKLHEAYRAYIRGS